MTGTIGLPVSQFMCTTTPVSVCTAPPCTCSCRYWRGGCNACKHLIGPVVQKLPHMHATDQHKMALQVMERVLSDLQAQHNSDPGDPKVGVVRLTGLAHTEDVAAFKQIAHQLCGCVVP